MATSQNGYSVPCGRIRSFIIPTKQGNVTLPLRDGAAGFILAHLALWFAERIEPLVGPGQHPRDDWGGANRTIRGDETTLSNHASYTAMDLNATKYPLGTRNMSRWKKARIKFALGAVYRLVVRSGIFYHSRPDEMHFEIDRDTADVRRLAERLVNTPRGKRILKANNMSVAAALTVKPW